MGGSSSARARGYLNVLLYETAWYSAVLRYLTRQNTLVQYHALSKVLVIAMVLNVKNPLLISRGKTTLGIAVVGFEPTLEEA